MTTVSCKAMGEIGYCLYYGTFVHAPNLGQIELLIDTVIGVDPTGTIDFIESGVEPGDSPLYEAVAQNISEKYRESKNVRAVHLGSNSSRFVVPGFIDTHIHASQYPNSGFGLGRPLLDWLNEYTFPLESRFSKDNIKEVTEIYNAVIHRTLSCGTTTALYYTTIDLPTSKLFAELALSQGQRAFVGLVCMDHNETYPSYKRDIQETSKAMEGLVKHVIDINPPGELLLVPIVTPRFAVTCLKKMLKFLGDFSNQHSLPVQTHIGENKAEIALVAKLFPEFEDYCLVYDSFGLIHRRTILAHAVYLSPHERQLIKHRGSSISHCPQSNTFLCSGQAPIHEYLYKDGINVGLGTDISGGYDPSILGAARECITVSHHRSMQSGDVTNNISVAEALHMATQGGAKAVGLENLVGLFKVGKRFDAQLINLETENPNVGVFSFRKARVSDTSPSRRKNLHDLVEKWLFCGDDRNCVKVWCNGRLVLNKVGSNESTVNPVR